MSKFAKWIGDHQVSAFFILAFLITWGLGFSYGAVVKHGRFLLVPLVFLATCGPALAGIIITTVTGPRQKTGHRATVWGAFFAAWIAAAVVCLAHSTLINRMPLSPRWGLLAALSVAPVALIISRAYSRSPAMRNYLAPLVRVKGVLGWIFLSLALLPGLSLISLAVSRGLGRASASLFALPVTGITLVGWIALKFLYQLFFFNATGEEAGWRGFALPRMQAHLSPLVASLVIALFWVPWHVFLWRAEGQAVQSLSFWLFSYLMHIPASVIICWLYNRSRGSILVAGVAHAAANTAFALLQNFDMTGLALTFYAFVGIIVLADRMWKKLPSGHPAVLSRSAEATT
jgi:membrane protease YdiL (CAAX protease family)